MATSAIAERISFPFQQEILSPIQNTPAKVNNSSAQSEKKKDIGDIVAGYTDMVSGAKNLVCKPIKQIVDIWKLITPDIPAEAALIGRAATDGKNILSAMELPGKLNKLKNSVVEFNPDRPIESTKEVFLKAVDCYSPVYDGIDFLQGRGITNIPADVMKGLGIGNAVALVIGTGYGTYDNATKIAGDLIEISQCNLNGAQTAEETQQEKAKLEFSLKKLLLHVIDVAKCISYVALGILTFIGLVFGIAFAPWILVALSTSALVFTIAGYFYDKIVEPTKRPELLNPTRAPVLVT